MSEQTMFVNKMKLYDTLSKTKKELKKPTRGRTLRFFVCGITVDDSPHVGHARAYILYDTFVKYLRHQGYKIFYLKNITDIEDKIIIIADREKVSTKQIAL